MTLAQQTFQRDTDIGGQISNQISTSKSTIFKLQISNLAKQIWQRQIKSNSQSYNPKSNPKSCFIQHIKFIKEKGRDLITLSCKFHGIKIQYYNDYSLQVTVISTSLCTAAVTPLLLLTDCCLSHVWWHQITQSQIESNICPNWVKCQLHTVKSNLLTVKSNHNMYQIAT